MLISSHASYRVSVGELGVSGNDSDYDHNNVFRKCSAKVGISAH